MTLAVYVQAQIAQKDLASLWTTVSNNLLWIYAIGLSHMSFASKFNDVLVRITVVLVHLQNLLHGWSKSVYPRVSRYVDQWYWES